MLGLVEQVLQQTVNGVAQAGPPYSASPVPTFTAS